MDYDFEKAFIAGAERISAWSDLLDEINVFPVADGDTGRNLAISLSPIRNLGGNRDKIKDLLLRCARGNSGNIASGFFSGFLSADSISNLHAAAVLGRDLAWRSVNDPKPGTMLSIFDSLAEELASQDYDTDGLWAGRVLSGLERTVNSTYELIPKLKEAGVVDAGALGMFIYLEGFFNALTGAGEFATISAIFKDRLRVSKTFNEKSESEFCVDMLLRVNNNSEETMRKIRETGESVVVIEDREFLKVHLHTDNKEEAMEKMESIGNVLEWRCDSLQEQIQRFGAKGKEGAIHIMTDAAGSITRDDAERLGITLLDSYITLQDRCLPETELSPKELYAAVRGGIKASTSQASVFERHEYYKSVLERYERVLYLCVGSVFTGNYSVSTDWKKKNDPDGRLTVVDTGAASGRLGAIVMAAAGYSSTGAGADAVIDYAIKMKRCCEEYIFIDRLKYLAAGGRLSKTNAFLGDMLHMKPVISPAPEGAVKVGLVRSQGDQISFAMTKLEQLLSRNSRAMVMLEYTDNLDLIEKIVLPEMRKKFAAAEIVIRPLSLTTGVHTGPGTWAIAIAPML